MKESLRFVELSGEVNEQHELKVSGPVPLNGPSKVKVLVFPEQEEDIPEDVWMRFLASNEAFAFLKDPEEDLYTLEDGKPFSNER